MKKYIYPTLFTLLLLLPAGGVYATETITLTSPDGKIEVTIRLADDICYTLSHNGSILMENNRIQLSFTNESAGASPKLLKKKETRVTNRITPLIPLKFSTIHDDYNQLLMDFKGNYSLEFRAYDEGIAYRFITGKKDTVEVLDEVVEFNFPTEYQLHLQQVWRTFGTPYEEPYTHPLSSEFTEESKMATLPVLIDTKKGCKILFSETNVFDYPAMLMQGRSGNRMKGAFPPCPLKQEYKGNDRIVISEEAGYIAQTKGKREYPWRFFVIAEKDGQLIENTMMYRLADNSQVADPSWILPGQTVWDWWNYAMPYDVDFVAGRNQDTYKYFIDFAAGNKIPYTLIDDGWSNSRAEPFRANPAVNMPELMEYARQKDVKVILWMHWTAIENHMDSIFKIYSDWGVAGLKIDFMERNDQWMVNFYERTAREAAANKMIVLFHGSFKPSGLEHKYPNVLAYEAVRGLEWKEQATADNGIYLPFMRNAVGPMDYTPGAMVSMQPEYYANNEYNPAAIGTRALQLAHFVIFESGMQMLADNPTRYNKEKECFDFITRVPVVWDETRTLAAEVGEYAVVAKRSGDQWFIGAMTNSKLPERVIEIELDFLKKENTFVMSSFEDGPNARYVAMDYKKRERTVKAGDKLKITLAKNGGWAAMIR